LIIGTLTTALRLWGAAWEPVALVSIVQILGTLSFFLIAYTTSVYSSLDSEANRVSGALPKRSVVLEGWDRTYRAVHRILGFVRPRPIRVSGAFAVLLSLLLGTGLSSCGDVRPGWKLVSDWRDTHWPVALAAQLPLKPVVDVLGRGIYVITLLTAIAIIVLALSAAWPVSNRVEKKLRFFIRGIALGASLYTACGIYFVILNSCSRVLPYAALLTWIILLALGIKEQRVGAATQRYTLGMSTAQVLWTPVLFFGLVSAGLLAQAKLWGLLTYLLGEYMVWLGSTSLVAGEGKT